MQKLTVIWKFKDKDEVFVDHILRGPDFCLWDVRNNPIEVLASAVLVYVKEMCHNYSRELCLEIAHTCTLLTVVEGHAEEF